MRPSEAHTGLIPQTHGHISQMHTFSSDSQRYKCVQIPECLKVTPVAITDERHNICGLTHRNLFLLHVKLEPGVPDWWAALPQALIPGSASFHFEAAPPLQGDCLSCGREGAGRVTEGRV